MADVKVCDRCGKMFPNKNRRFTIIPTRYILGMITRKFMCGGGYRDIRKEYDLCCECFEDLEKFLMSKTKE